MEELIDAAIAAVSPTARGKYISKQIQDGLDNPNILDRITPKVFNPDTEEWEIAVDGFFGMAMRMAILVDDEFDDADLVESKEAINTLRPQFSEFRVEMYAFGDNGPVDHLIALCEEMDFTYGGELTEDSDLLASVAALSDTFV